MEPKAKEKLAALMYTIEAHINPDQENKTFGFVVSLVPLNQPDLRALTSYLGSNIPNPVTDLVLQQSLNTIRSVETPHDLPKEA